MSSLWKRLFRRRQIDREVLEELESHLAMRADLNRQDGLSDEEARKDARRRFGNPNRIRQQILDFNGFGTLDEIAQDLREGLRTLRRYPSVTGLALLSLTLGIGANTVTFTFVNALLFSSLPYPDPGELVIAEDGITLAECSELGRRKEIFQEFGCIARLVSSASVAGDAAGTELPEQLEGQSLSAALGRALAVTPQLGRWISESDERNPLEPVVLISHRLWQRRFSGSSQALGKTIWIDGVATSLVGVMAPDFEFLNSAADYWLPLPVPELEASNSSDLIGLGRLRKEASLEQARAVLDALVERRGDGSLSSASPPRVRLNRLIHFVSSRFRDSSFILQGTVAFVLLIACANVVGLLLAQAASQQRETAVRAALGSGTWRIMRRVVVYNLLLFSVGGLTGLAAGWAGARLMGIWVLSTVQTYGAPQGGIPRAILEAGIDSRVFLFTFALALSCGLLAAIAPALQSGRTRPLEILRGSSERTTLSAPRHRARSAFVALQIALAFVLLVGVSLMLNGFRRSLDQGLGFDPRNLLNAHVQLLSRDSGSRADRSLKERLRLDPLQLQQTEQMRLELARIPGVESATAIAIAPPLSGAVNLPAVADGSARGEEMVQFLPILPDYFKTLGVEIAHGRELEPGKHAETLPVAIINESAAQLFWPNQNPLGRSIQLRAPGLPDEPPRQVAGVVPEVKQYSFQDGRPQLYVPLGQIGRIEDEGLRRRVSQLTFIVRSSQSASELSSPVAAAISQVSPHQAVSRVRTLEQTVFAATLRRGTYVMMVAVFGMIAVALAVMGVYGVMANLVAERFHELGIRIALGATPRQVRREVIGKGLVLIGIGVALGVAGAMAITNVLRSMLFGLSPRDPVTFTAVVLALAGVALLACALPAWKASRIDVLAALRR